MKNCIIFAKLLLSILIVFPLSSCNDSDNPAPGSVPVNNTDPSEPGNPFYPPDVPDEVSDFVYKGEIGILDIVILVPDFIQKNITGIMFKGQNWYNDTGTDLKSMLNQFVAAPNVWKNTDIPCTPLREYKYTYRTSGNILNSKELIIAIYETSDQAGAWYSYLSETASLLKAGFSEVIKKDKQYCYWKAGTGKHVLLQADKIIYGIYVEKTDDIWHFLYEYGLSLNQELETLIMEYEPEVFYNEETYDETKLYQSNLFITEEYAGINYSYCVEIPQYEDLVSTITVGIRFYENEDRAVKAFKTEICKSAEYAIPQIVTEVDSDEVLIKFTTGSHANLIWQGYRNRSYFKCYLPTSKDLMDINFNMTPNQPDHVSDEEWRALNNLMSTFYMKCRACYTFREENNTITLNNLIISSEKPVPDFDPDIHTYNLDVADSTGELELTCFADANFQIKVNRNTDVTQGTACSVPLDKGDNVINITVSDQENADQALYKIYVHRYYTEKVYTGDCVIEEIIDGPNFFENEYTQVTGNIDVVMQQSPIYNMTDPHLYFFERLYSVGGSLVIGNSNPAVNTDVQSLYGLNNLKNIGGLLAIREMDLLYSLYGIKQLQEIAGLDLYGNSDLRNIDALDSLDISSLNYLRIARNSMLENVDCLEKINTVNGDVVLEHISEETDLHGLRNIESIHGSLSLLAVNKSDLTVFNNLTYVGGTLSIISCDSMNSLRGLDNLRGFKGVTVDNNPGLINLDQLAGMTQEVDVIEIKNNNSLVNINGIGNVLLSGGDVVIESNSSLEDINGLSNLQEIGGNLALSDLSIGSLSPLSMLKRVDGDLTLAYLEQIENINALNNLQYVNGLSFNNINKLGNIFFDAITINQSLIVNSNDSLLTISVTGNSNSLFQFAVLYNPVLREIELGGTEMIEQVYIRDNPQLERLSIPELKTKCIARLTVSGNASLPQNEIEKLLPFVTGDAVVTIENNGI